ncbi:hypothetical protein AB0D94_23525 [Streptomyces sp. NPDC048255]|uniref:hypothetical protein n=1 Tax=Streptomyces sp. NPDC048255 TaxID=3154713 RepID=UPI003407CBD9
MSTQTPEAEAPGPVTDAVDITDQPAEREPKAPAEERAQQAWATRRELNAHAPRSMRFDGTNDGVVADLIVGDVVTGDKTEINYLFGDLGATHASGEIPEASLHRLADTFVADGTPFESLLERLREERVLVLTGAPFTGRRTAALMLLHRVGATPVHALDRETSPADLSRQFTTPGKARGHLLCDLVIRRDQPLREAHLLALRSRMKEHNGYLVITTGHSPYIESDIRPAPWSPPAAEAVLSARLHRQAGDEAARRLLALPAVTEFLARDHQLREVAGYATLLIRHAQGAADTSQVERYSLLRLESQIQEWFEEAETTLPLREKAFLITLASFDGGPYALTAELSDLLYSELRRTGDPDHNERIPVFGTHIGKRLLDARAQTRPATEDTEWGPVNQLTASFKDDRTSPVLLREVWTGHPSARPALVKWLGKLANDGRPLVRTRAAATVAVLAYTDLPSAMALVIEPWALSAQARQRTTAVSALTLAHRIGAPNIPRIIDGWSTDAGEPRRCWVAIRAQGLIGPERPKEAVAALRAQARLQSGKGKPDQLVAEELPESVALLLLSLKGDEILTDLLRTLDDHRSAFVFAVKGFLAACRRTDERAGHERPLVLDWYARAAHDRNPSAPGIVLLLRTALDDREFTTAASEVLRSWITAADRDEAAEWALAALLPALVTTPREFDRLDYLLRKPQGDDGGPHTAVADRLRSALTIRLA